MLGLEQHVSQLLEEHLEGAHGIRPLGSDKRSAPILQMYEEEGPMTETVTETVMEFVEVNVHRGFCDQYINTMLQDISSSFEEFVDDFESLVEFTSERNSIAVHVPQVRQTENAQQKVEIDITDVSTLSNFGLQNTSTIVQNVSSSFEYLDNDVYNEVDSSSFEALLLHEEEPSESVSIHENPSTSTFSSRKRPQSFSTAFKESSMSLVSSSKIPQQSCMASSMLWI